MKVVDNGTQRLSFEGVPWERLLVGHDSRGGDGGGFRIRLLERPPVSHSNTRLEIGKRLTSYRISCQFSVLAGGVRPGS